MNTNSTMFADISARMHAEGNGDNIEAILRQRWALPILARGLSIGVHTRQTRMACGTRRFAERMAAERGGQSYASWARCAFAWGEDWFLEETVIGSRLFYAAHAGGEPTCPGIVAAHADEPAVRAKRVAWWRVGQRGLESKAMHLVGADPHEEFYPWLQPATISSLWHEYMASDANVMLLIGPPGTGKTSFIRGGLRAVDAAAWVTYDKAAQVSEELYTRFADPEPDEDAGDEDGDDPDDDILSTLAVAGSRRPGRGARLTSSNGRVLVLEDADTMLESRRDGNELMRRILGIADGLVSLPKRKVVFTTNLPNLSSVDDALLRPGRCFAVLNFRKLTAKEAEAAARAVGQERSFDAARNYTLAEALKTRVGAVDPVRRLGF